MCFLRTDRSFHKPSQGFLFDHNDPFNRQSLPVTHGKTETSNGRETIYDKMIEKQTHQLI